MSVCMTRMSTGRNGDRPAVGRASSITRRPIEFVRPVYQRPASNSVWSAGAISAANPADIVTSRSRMQSR